MKRFLVAALGLSAFWLGAQGLPAANPAITAPAMGSSPSIGLPGQSAPAVVGKAPPSLPPPAPGGATADATAAPPLAYGSVFEGRASWYGAAFKGRKTASGEIYDPEGLTAAHRSLPFGSLLRVTDLDTGASVVVRVNDRGPFVADRVIDLSEAAARLIGLLPNGTTLVRCEVLRPEDAAAFGQPPSASPPPPPPVDRSCRVQIASYAQQSNADTVLERLKLSGIDAVIEVAGPYKRIVLPSVRESELDALRARLGGLGYRNLLISYGP